MRKAVMIVLALAAIRLLPRALRREAQVLELITVLCQAMLATAANTSKAYATEQRTAVLEQTAGRHQAAITAIQTTLAGSTGPADNGGNTSNTISQGGDPAKTGAADNGGNTSGPSGTVSAFPAAGPNHTHAMDHHHPVGHNHAMAHAHLL